MSGSLVTHMHGGNWAAASVNFPPASKIPPLRILIVDDEALLRWALTETLAADGHEVAEAADAAAAVRAISLAANPFDIAILDLRLPDSRDLMLLSTVRRLTPRTRVILMTAYGSPDVEQGALDLGAARVVTKPLEMTNLPALIADAYGHA
jgi:DNA-binding NtrC family response regulator